MGCRDVSPRRQPATSVGQAVAVAEELVVVAGDVGSVVLDRRTGAARANGIFPVGATRPERTSIRAWSVIPKVATIAPAARRPLCSSSTGCHGARPAWMCAGDRQPGCTVIRPTLGRQP